MGSTPIKQSEAQVVEFQLHVQYSLSEFYQLNSLLEAVQSLIDTARGDGTVICALLSGLPQPLDLK